MAEAKKKDSDAYKYVESDLDKLDANEVSKIEKLLADRKANIKKEQEANILKWKKELEDYAQSKYGVPLARIFLARDPNAPAKDNTKGKPKPGFYQLADGSYREWKADSRMSGSFKDYDFAAAEAQGKYRERQP